MIWLGEEIWFPPYELANKDGVLALGGDLSSERLVYAYQNGIFPWFNEGEPIVWYSPWQRMVLFPEELKVSKSMKQVLRKADFTITENRAFEEMIFNCKTIDRNDQFGTWITDDMQQAYINLHKQGFAKSIEVWKEDRLVGGLYGIDLGNGVFCGESMFSKASNMSKVAFIHLAKKCNYKLIDCQVYNEHLASLGAREIDRSEFLKWL
ncbi:leucyl/phenylalanyl-tRNA--protein transferase [Tenacibaculum sp. S7007]|uniref:Leucyl/phenylalanyl-tRNA--protein transferase n=1 Tax=Tenacibaculum pelagium TaxID=2759527 RepID=A0A839AMV9_9FLAO|nr:leucyl/phenylalanyl-tRNA--protein transferase [Tenacibaculum pelagium]MBA6155710.1 leucyl/phenylalanyl-tRNA--protein transferase [Tenacibaculum pelagium]